MSDDVTLAELDVRARATIENAIRVCGEDSEPAESLRRLGRALELLDDEPRPSLQLIQGQGS